MSVTVEPKELTKEEFVRLIETRVQATLGISLEEFSWALREGQLDPESPRVAELALLVGA